jgi:ATP-binding cassette subfamily B protein
VVQTFFQITPALIYLVARWIITGSLPIGADALTTGTLGAFTTLQGRLQMPLLALVRVTLDVQTSLALFRRIFEYLDLEPAISEKPDAVALEVERMEGRVEFRDVSFRYPPPRPVHASEPPERVEADRDAWALRGVDLEVEPGQLAAIVGPSGAGKTTATYLVPRFYDVTEGAVLIDGYDVRDLTPVLAGRRGRHGDPGALPLPRHDPGEPRLRAAFGDRGGDRRGGAGRQHPRPWRSPTGTRR